MLFLAGVEGRYIHYFQFPHVQKTCYSSVSLLLLLCKELGVQYIALFLSGGGLRKKILWMGLLCMVKWCGVGVYLHGISV